MWPPFLSIKWVKMALYVYMYREGRSVWSEQVLWLFFGGQADYLKRVTQFMERVPPLG